jgi:riboflavin biosynthesis pyrimidine reductase
VRRLHPEPARETSAAEEAHGLDLVALAPDDRPYVITNFVLSLDGRATLEGRSGPIGSDVDTEMLVALRTRVDALLIGAGTMRAERYGGIMRDPGKRERREREGLPPVPLMVIVSGSLELPWDAPLFTEGVGDVLIWTSSEADPPATETPVTVERFDGPVELGAALANLRTGHGVRALLCEGGPRLHAELIESSLVDELFVTHAPLVVGGQGPTLVTGLPERERPLELAWLLRDESAGELFARYRVP